MRCRRPRVSILLLALAASSCGNGGSHSIGSDRPTQPRRPTTAGAPSTLGNSSSAGAGNDDSPSARVELTEIASGLDSPVAFAVRAGDATLYIAEQTGRVRAVKGGHLDDGPVLDISGDLTAGGEQGLLGLCFSPGGDLLYVDFTDLDGNTRVQEFSMLADGTADVGSRRELLRVNQPYPNHNGGQVTFGPDGMLYIGLGDGGGAGDPDGNGQNLRTLLGKILRIDPRPSGDAPYSVPSDNPFVGNAEARPEIWMYGLRNPWRFSWDRETRDLWIGDVGQDLWEEIDVAPAGKSGLDFGWNAREGAHDYEGPVPDGLVEPVYEYPHADGRVSITGGFVYRGHAIGDLVGAYVFADYAQGGLAALTQDAGIVEAERDLGVNGGLVTSFGEDDDGELYVLDINGRVLRLDPA